mgnify:FL=1
MRNRGNEDMPEMDCSFDNLNQIERFSNHPYEDILIRSSASTQKAKQ